MEPASPNSVVMSTGSVVSHPPFYLHGSAVGTFKGASHPSTHLLLTPPDSPSSDDDEKNGGATSPASSSPSPSSLFPSFPSGGDSSSGSEEVDDEGGGPVGALVGRAGGPSCMRGVLIECAVPSRAWGSESPSAGASSDRERERERDPSCWEGGGRQECRHGSCEDDAADLPNYPRCPTVCVMQQKGGAQPPMTTLSEPPSQSAPMGCPPPLRSVLKRSGQRSRGHHVTINESKNEVVEADYVILVRDEDEPQLVSIRTYDLGLNSSAVDQVTLSPPDGYKDVFGHAIHENIDDSDTEAGGVDVTSGWRLKVHDPDCPRANLPDVVATPRRPPPTLTVENVRHHDQLMEDNHVDGEEEEKVAKTGILKGGKLWKNGDSRKQQRVEVEKMERTDEPRRSVRFSGRDEYTTLEEADFDKLPFDLTNEDALARFFSPKLQELRDLLGEQQEDWLLELSPIVSETAMTNFESMVTSQEIQHLPTCAKHSQSKLNHTQMEDEHISESVPRYEEMRRRIAMAEGRDTNSVCSDESKSSSDSQSSDSTPTETRIRRLENTDVAHIAGGVMRSNSEVRRAIERNALRRSLIRFAEARKKDTNKNDKNEKQENSLIEKLKWLTTSEDATNGNADEKAPPHSKLPEPPQSRVEEEEVEKKSRGGENRITCTIEQYRKLAEMFNKTTSLRVNDINVPGDVREWKLEADLFPCEKIITDLENDELPPGTLTFTAVPAVSVCEQMSDDESEKLIYSGGIRYTKEGILPLEQQRQQQESLRERSSESYTVNDIDEVLHDDRSSSVPSSSQSSPRLSGRSDVDGTSTAESGYSSNETNSELGHLLPPELDELAEFVKQDADRMDRLRKRYDEAEDHGFCRRPSVRGIKPRFVSTTDLLKQMANQLVPPNTVQPSLAVTHMTWPYRDGNEDGSSGRGHSQRRRVTPPRNNPLPALQEDIPYGTSSDTLISSSVDGSTLRTVHSYSSTGDLRTCSNGRLSVDSSDIVRLPGHLPPQRAQSYSSLTHVNQFIPSQASSQCHRGVTSNDHHHSSCGNRRPASVHGHAPTDMLVSGPQHPTPPNPRSFHTLPHQSHPRSQCQSHEETDHNIHESSHISLGPRGTYPNPGSSSQYISPIIHDHHNNVPITYQHSSQLKIDSVDIQAPMEHQSSSTYSTHRLPSGHTYERNYCPGWYSSNSNPNFVHSPHSIPPPIVSSQMSYITPIVPEGSSPHTTSGNLVSGILMKMELERGVPEGASSSPRVIMDPQYPLTHHGAPRESDLIHHHPQAMNVST